MDKHTHEHLLDIRNNIGAIQVNSSYQPVTRLTPKDGAWAFPSVTKGFMVIELPQDNYTYTMMSINLHFYLYYTGKSFSITASGYDHQVPRWYNTSVKRTVGLFIPEEYNTVRFMRKTVDGVASDNDADYKKFILVIGKDASTNWHYLQLAIMESLFGYYGGTIKNWNEGWKAYKINEIPEDWKKDSTIMV